MAGSVGEIRRKLGLKSKVPINITSREPLQKAEREVPASGVIKITSTENTPSYLKQEGNTTMCVPFALCNAAIEQLRANSYNGLLPFTPQELFQSVQTINGAIDQRTGMLTQLGIINMLSRAQSWLDMAGTPINIEGCRDFDILYRGLCESKSAVIFHQDITHELTILSYDSKTDNVVVFDSLGDGLTKTYRFNTFKDQIKWGAAGTANRLISFKKSQSK